MVTLAKLPKNHVVVALNMVGINVDPNLADLIQNTIHETIHMGVDFDLMTAAKLRADYESSISNTLVELNAQYRVLSQLYNPKSKHSTQIEMGKMLDKILKDIETINKKVNGTKNQP